MKIGIIGCGKIAQVHSSLLKKITPNATLIFCDRNKHKADSFAQKFSPGSTTYTSADDLISGENLDAVHILTQIQSHALLAQKALEQDVNVFIEKPITERAAEFESLLALANNKGKRICAGYSKLGLPVVQKAKQLITSGKYGKLVTAHCDYNWAAHGNDIPYGDENHWAYSLKGGILQNLADHPACLIVDVLDDEWKHNVTFKRRVSLPNNSPDLMHVSLGNDHQIGTFTMSFGHGNTRGHVTYCVESATIDIDLRNHLLTVTPGRGPQSFPRRVKSSLKMSWDIGIGTVGSVFSRTTGRTLKNPGIAGLLTNFYQVINTDGDLIVSDRTAAPIVSLLETIWDEVPPA